MASTTTRQLPPWSDLPADVLGQVLARVPLPADRARFRAACRSWRSPQGWRLPWIVHRDGTFVTFPDRGLHRLPLPDNASFLGATNGGWLALERVVEGDEHTRNYCLHNPFTGTTLPLPGLDSVIGGKNSEWFEVRKVLMSSTVDDIIVVRTNHWDCPIILCRAGKPGAWIPKPFEMPYARIIDVEFLGDHLYGITSHEELVLFDLDEDDEGRPTVSSVKYVIRNPMREDMIDDHELEHSEGLSDEEEEGDLSDDEDDEQEYNEERSTDEEDNVYDDDGHEYNNDDEEENSVLGSDEASSVNEEIDDDDEVVDEDIDEIIVPDNEVPVNLHFELKDIIWNSWHLVESNGKLLMVRRQKCTPVCFSEYNIKIDLLMADMDTGSWVPAVCEGLEQGQRLFISKRFCKSVPAPTKDLTCCFVDESDIDDDSSEPLYDYEYYDTRSTWVFPPEVVL